MMNDIVSPPSDIWSFRLEADGWRWRRTSIRGEELARSHTTFGSLEMCAEDAARCGYAVTTEGAGSVHGLVGSLSPGARSFRIASDVHPDIERDTQEDDDVQPDYPDGETP